jgi:hypothetical protein
LTDKVFYLTLDNASSNTSDMNTSASMFAGYLGSDPEPILFYPQRPHRYNLLCRCACHIINLIVKSSLMRLKPYTLRLLELQLIS